MGFVVLLVLQVSGVVLYTYIFRAVGVRDNILSIGVDKSFYAARF
jgi:hypothetical protein